MALFLHICLHVSSSGAVKTTLKLWVLLACMLYRILRSKLRTGRTTTKETTWIIRLKSARNDFLFVSNFRQRWIVYSVADICGFYSCVHGGRKTLVWSFAWNSACQPSLPRGPVPSLTAHTFCVARSFGTNVCSCMHENSCECLCSYHKMNYFSCDRRNVTLLYVSIGTKYTTMFILQPRSRWGRKTRAPRASCALLPVGMLVCDSKVFNLSQTVI